MARGGVEPGWGVEGGGVGSQVVAEVGHVSARRDAWGGGAGTAVIMAGSCPLSGRGGWLSRQGGGAQGCEDARSEERREMRGDEQARMGAIQRVREAAHWGSRSVIRSSICKSGAMPPLSSPGAGRAKPPREKVGAASTAGGVCRRSIRAAFVMAEDGHAVGAGGASAPTMLLRSAGSECEIGWGCHAVLSDVPAVIGSGRKDAYVGECDSTTGSAAGVNVVRGLWLKRPAKVVSESRGLTL